MAHNSTTDTVDSRQADARVLDLWLQNFDLFWADMRRFVVAVAHGVGCGFHFDESALRVAHANWAARCQLWERERIQKESDGLSHVKVLSLMLFQFATLDDWATSTGDCAPIPEGIENPYTGMPKEVRDAIRDALLDEGGSTYLAFQFVVHMINWYEMPRIDRDQAFEFRLTEDMEHDLMAYLLSDSKDELALFLIFKALYTRDGGVI